jgi:hypothetical protein
MANATGIERAKMASAMPSVAHAATLSRAVA